jgi:zinc transporter, ZIP family
MLRPVFAAFAWGFLAAATLIAGGFYALHRRVGDRTLGIVMAFGSGVLISSVAYELVGEAFAAHHGNGAVAGGLFAGSLVFFTGDTLIDRMGGADRKDSGGGQASGSPLAIVLGIVLDGIPESIVLGLTIVVSGSVSAAFLIAVALSNVPEAVAATTGLARSGWSGGRILGLWTLVALVSGAAALVGFVAFDDVSTTALAFVLAFAAGAILTMLADTMMPEAYELAGPLVGVVVTVGFAVAFGLSALE